MNFRRILLPWTALIFTTWAPAQDRVSAAFEKFWAAESPEQAGRIAQEIAKAGISFDDAARRLKQGRAYTAQQPGVVMLSNKTSDGVEHNFAVTVPPAYDPARRYQVRFQLHGGVYGRSDNKPRNSGEIGALAGAEQFYVIPYSWSEAPWWGEDQILNLNAIVDALKRRYNIDENRVAVAGVSDGATGAYYIAMRETTPFASFLPLNGFLMVLGVPEIDDGRIFPNNLLNKPLFVVNGGRDRLYPLIAVEPYTRHLMEAGVSIDYHPRPEAEHNTRWWPEVKDAFERFVALHPRDPHPAKLTWEAAGRDHGRAHWLVIDEFGAAAGEAKRLPDANAALDSRQRQNPNARLFASQKASGRVDLIRTGNAVEASTRGVRAFTLLLSPDCFDFEQPVRVTANGREVFNARVKRDSNTLLKWAARDNDRTMLYGAEIQIKLGK